MGLYFDMLDWISQSRGVKRFKHGAFSSLLMSHRVVGTPGAQQLQPRHSLYNRGPGVALQNTCSIALLSSDSNNSLDAGENAVTSRTILVFLCGM